MSARSRVTSCLLLAATTVSLTAIQASGQGAGLKVFHIGNSLTDQSYGMHNIAEGKGYTNVLYGRQMIPGAPVKWLWEHPNDGFKQVLSKVTQMWPPGYTVSTPEYLATTSVDALVLQLFAMNGDNAQTMIEFGGNFAEAAYRGNPDCQVYVFGSYPSRQDDYAKELPRLNTMAVQGAAGISARFPDRKPVLVAPVMQAFEQARPTNMYADLAHASNEGKYLQSLVLFSTIYRADPRGAVTSGLFYWEGPYSIDKATATKLQDIAWKVVTSYPQSGYNGTTAAEPGTAWRARPARVLPGAPAAQLDLQGRLLSTVWGNRSAAYGLACTAAGAMRATMLRAPGK